MLFHYFISSISGAHLALCTRTLRKSLFCQVSELLFCFLTVLLLANTTTELHCALCILVMHNLWHLKWRAHIQTIADLLPLRNAWPA